MTTQPNREQEICAEAMEIASSSKRRTFVDRACGDDNALAKRVLALLAGHESTAQTASGSATNRRARRGDRPL